MNLSVKVEETSKVKRKLTITVPAKDVDQQFQSQLAEVQRKAKLKGFRPGKVPMSVVKQYYGDDVKYRVLNTLVDEGFRQAVTNEHLKPVGRPNIEGSDPDKKLHLHEGKDLTFTATVEIMPEIQAKDYKGLKLTRDNAEVTDADIEKTVTQVRESHGEMMTLEEDRPAKMADLVDLEFKGGIVKDGNVELRDDMAGSRTLEIGSGDLIPGFEEQLVGMKKGTEKTFRISFPKDYHAPELAGSEAEFTAKVNDLKIKKVPELTEEFSKEAGYESIADMRQKIREGMTQHKADEVERKLKSDLLQELINKNPFDLPEALVQAQARHLLEEFARDLKRNGFNEQMVQQAVINELENLKKRAESQVRAGLILDSIAKQEKIEVTSEDYVREYAEMSKSMGATEEEIKKYYEGAEDRKENLDFRIRENKTMKLIVDAAKVKAAK